MLVAFVDAVSREVLHAGSQSRFVCASQIGKPVGENFVRIA